MQATALPTTSAEKRATIGELLQTAVGRLSCAGIEEPLRESQLLVAHALGISRLEVITSPERIINRYEFSRITKLISRRARRVPIAYLRGSQEFYGLEFEVSADVLVPRPETELLVDIARDLLQSIERPLVVDAGTGSGCLAVSIAKAIPEARLITTDNSSRALQVARRNAARHSVEDRVKFEQTDFLAGLDPASADLIVSNPPYIPTAALMSLQPEVQYHEPRTALDGGQDGLECYRTLASQGPSVLKSGASLVVEVGAGQAVDVWNLFGDAELIPVGILKDLAGIERVVRAQKP